MTIVSSEKVRCEHCNHLATTHQSSCKSCRCNLSHAEVMDSYLTQIATRNLVIARDMSEFISSVMVDISNFQLGGTINKKSADVLIAKVKKLQGLVTIIDLPEPVKEDWVDE